MDIDILSNRYFYQGNNPYFENVVVINKKIYFIFSALRNETVYLFPQFKKFDIYVTNNAHK